MGKLRGHRQRSYIERWGDGSRRVPAPMIDTRVAVGALTSKSPRYSDTEIQTLRYYDGEGTDGQCAIHSISTTILATTIEGMWSSRFQAGLSRRLLGQKTHAVVI